MFRRPPRWVNDLNNSNPNKVLLLRIFEASNEPLESPKKILFALKGFTNTGSAKAAVEGYLDKEGLDSRIDLDDSTKKYWVESAKIDYVLSLDSLVHDEAFFDKIANLYGAKYDGWTVVIPPKR
jgi:hypothetical protein